MDKNELFDTTIGSYEDYKESKRKLNTLLGKSEEKKKEKYNYLKTDKEIQRLCNLKR